MMKKKTAAVCGMIMTLIISSALPVLAEEKTADASAEWEKKAVTTEQGYVNIRSGAGTEEELVGVLFPGSVAEVLGRKGDWTRIHSGNVDGYIRSDLLVSGEEARARYEAQSAPQCGTVSADVLCVRAGRNASDDILGVMLAGTKLNFTGYEDGWYEIAYDGRTAYVSEAYVAPADKVETALTMDEFYVLADQGLLPSEDAAVPAAAVTEEAAPAEEVYTEETYVPAAVYTDAAAVTDSIPAALPEDTAVYTETPVYTETQAAAADTASAADTGIYTDMTGAAEDYTVSEEYGSGDLYDAAAGSQEGYDTALYDQTGYDTASYDETGYDTGAYDQAGYDTAAYGSEADYTSDNTGTEAAAGVSQSDLDLLAAIIQCEAGGESYTGKVAVGACVLNRMESGSFPDTISDVIYQSGQFTPAMTGSLDQTLAEGARADCYEAAQAALAGENPIGDLLFFHAGGGDGLTIGNQTFY